MRRRSVGESVLGASKSQKDIDDTRDMCDSHLDSTIYTTQDSKRGATSARYWRQFYEPVSLLNRAVPQSRLPILQILGAFLA